MLHNRQCLPSTHAGLTPAQVLFDDIHPADWISFEFVNVYLNLIQEYQRVAATKGSGVKPSLPSAAL